MTWGLSELYQLEKFQEAFQNIASCIKPHFIVQTSEAMRVDVVEVGETMASRTSAAIF